VSLVANISWFKLSLHAKICPSQKSGISDSSVLLFNLPLRILSEDPKIRTTVYWGGGKGGRGGGEQKLKSLTISVNVYSQYLNMVASKRKRKHSFRRTRYKTNSKLTKKMTKI